MTSTALSSYLQQVKSKFPDKTDATILLEPDTPYDTVVQVMDRMRVLEVNAGLNVRAVRAVSRYLDRRCTGDGRRPPAARRGARQRPARPQAPSHDRRARMSMSNRARRMLQHQLRHRADAELNLIPMIDILSVMVSFLLVYSTNVEVLQNTKAHRDSAVDRRAAAAPDRGGDAHQGRAVRAGRADRLGGRDPRHRRRHHRSRCATR